MFVMFSIALFFPTLRGKDSYEESESMDVSSKESKDDYELWGVVGGECGGDGGSWD